MSDAIETLFVHFKKIARRELTAAVLTLAEVTRRKYDAAANASDTASDSLFTVNRVAESLTVSTRSVRRLLQTGALPHIRLGRAIRIRPEDLEAYTAGLAKGDSGISESRLRELRELAGVPKRLRP
jgi:excisionase family DNA binding protein